MVLLRNEPVTRQPTFFPLGTSTGIQFECREGGDDKGGLVWGLDGIG